MAAFTIGQARQHRHLRPGFDRDLVDPQQQRPIGAQPRQDRMIGRSDDLGLEALGDLDPVVLRQTGHRQDLLRPACDGSGRRH